MDCLVLQKRKERVIAFMLDFGPKKIRFTTFKDEAAMLSLKPATRHGKTKTIVMQSHGHGGKKQRHGF